MESGGGLVAVGDGAIGWRGFEHGVPVLLVAGQGVTQFSWDPWLAELGAGIRAVTFDHRGLGESVEGSAPPRSTRELAADAAAVIEACCGSDGRSAAADDGADSGAHVIGHSMGGRAVQWLAIDRPELVLSLTLVATTGGDALGAQRDASATADLVSGDPTRLAPRFVGDAYRATHPGVAELFARREAKPSTLRRFFAASSQHDAWDELGRISAPTLVVHGQADTITPVGNGRMLAERIPGAEYFEVPRGRHAPHLDNPQVAQRIRSFVLAHDPDASVG